MERVFWPFLVKTLVAVQIIILCAYLVFSVAHFRDFFALTVVSILGMGILLAAFGWLAKNGRRAWKSEQKQGSFTTE